MEKINGNEAYYLKIKDVVDMESSYCFVKAGAGEV